MSSESGPHVPRDTDSLQTMKQRIRGKYLGRFGIHGVGMRTRDSAVRVYASIGGADQEVVLEEIRREVAPFKLDVIFEDRPSAQHGA